MKSIGIPASIRLIDICSASSVTLHKHESLSTEYLNTRPWRVNFVSRQVDFRFTCLYGQFEILEKYQKFSYLSLNGFECLLHER